MARNNRLIPQSLVVSSEVSQQFTTGDLLNLMSVDVDNVFEFVQYSTLIWGGFVRILSSLAIIWFQLGPSCLAGLFVILACVPFTVSLGKATAQYQVRDILHDQLSDNHVGTITKDFFAFSEVILSIAETLLEHWQLTASHTREDHFNRLCLAELPAK